MFKKLKDLQSRKSDQGFTIIEVMIVLAIAALILLIVLLAVPALQRSSANTSRKNDASAIEAALSNFVNDNNGVLPTEVGGGSSSNVLMVGTTSTTNTEQANMGYYKSTAGGALGANTGSDIYIVAAPATGTATTPTAVSSSTAASATSVTTNSVSIIVGESCNNGTYTLSARDIAISYVTDTGSGNGALQCTET